jgi:hypothetical protein
MGAGREVRHVEPSRIRSRCGERRHVGRLVVSVRTAAVLLGASILPWLCGCLNSYSHIDSKNWQAFEEALPTGGVAYSVPGGSIAGPPGVVQQTQWLRSFNYDVLSGPSSYGVWGETKLDLFLSTAAFDSGVAFLRSVWPEEMPESRASGEWEWVHFDNPKGHTLARWYFRRLPNGQLLIVRAFLSDAVYDRAELRQSRIQLVEDVVNTFQFHN